MKYIAAIDQGTTSTRCLIFDKKGQVKSISQKEHKQIYPKPGWVEHNPLEIMENTKEVILAALHNAKITSHNIDAVGITNQRETTVAWNRQTGEPYYNALVWQDTRTDNICEALKERSLSEIFKETNGLPIATYFSGPKIKWLIDNIPEINKDVKNGKVCFGNIDSWLIWNLTGGKQGGKFVTDVTNASRTMLFNLNSLAWDEELLTVLGLSRENLPSILPSSTAFGTMAGPLEGVPITGVLGDQQASLFGQACLEPGDAKNTYGTGCFMLLNTGSKIYKSKNGLLTTVAYQIEDEAPVFALEGSIAVTGALVQWYRDNLGIISNTAEIEELAKTVKDNGDVYFVPAFSGLFAPHWDASARGLIIGLTRFANKGHIARAILESTAYQSYEVLVAMQKDTNIDLNLLKVDGGMVNNHLLMQFQADILGKKVVRPTVTETTAMGAAYAAGLQTGFWKSTEEIKQNWVSDTTWTPSMSEDQRQTMLLKWNKAVQHSSGWTNS